ncbi:MAG: hypothetical protein K1W35_14040 [Lachnospiraceae bacterium]
MKRKVLIVITAVVTIIVLIAVIIIMHSNSKSSYEKEEQSTIEGTVLEINETNILISESGYVNGENYLIISDDTVVYIGGEESDISKIEVGQVIKAVYIGGIDEIYPGRVNGVIEIIVE